jgi:hypothetical protein
LIAGLQRRASQSSTIVLADELEYGLEPHRIIRFLGSLGAKEAQPPLQAFLTTHSPVALRELSGAQLFVVRGAPQGHTVQQVGLDNHMQSAIRKYPEAFFARSVIVCEGASEIGFLRGLDLYRASIGLASLAALGVSLIDSGGGTPDQAYSRGNVFLQFGYRVMVVRDADILPSPAVEQTFLANGGRYTAWGDGFALEDELFNSLPSSSCLDLVGYAVELHDSIVNSNIQSASDGALSIQTLNEEITSTGSISTATRHHLGRASRTKKNGWFKSISWMEEVARNHVAPALYSPLYEVDATFAAKVASIFDWATDAEG